MLIASCSGIMERKATMIKRCLLLLAISLVVNTGVAESPPAALLVVHIETGPNWNESLARKDQSGFREHSANPGRLREQGVMLFGARYDDLGIVVLKAATLDDAKALMEADPGVQAGIFPIARRRFVSSIRDRSDVQPHAPTCVVPVPTGSTGSQKQPRWSGPLRQFRGCLSCVISA